MDKISILVVDDHPLFRQGLRDLLRSEPDLEVVGEGADGQEAIDLTHALQPDALILDINLPGLNGLQVTRQLRSERSTAQYSSKQPSPSALSRLRSRLASMVCLSAPSRIWLC